MCSKKQKTSLKVSAGGMIDSEWDWKKRQKTKFWGEKKGFTLLHACLYNE